jgi:hypothetical protein
VAAILQKTFLCSVLLPRIPEGCVLPPVVALLLLLLHTENILFLEKATFKEQ